MIKKKKSAKKSSPYGKGFIPYKKIGRAIKKGAKSSGKWAMSYPGKTYEESVAFRKKKKVAKKKKKVAGKGKKTSIGKKIKKVAKSGGKWAVSYSGRTYKESVAIRKKKKAVKRKPSAKIKPKKPKKTLKKRFKSAVSKGRKVEKKVKKVLKRGKVKRKGYAGTRRASKALAKGKFYTAGGYHGLSYEEVRNLDKPLDKAFKKRNKTIGKAKKDFSYKLKIGREDARIKGGSKKILKKVAKKKSKARKKVAKSKYKTAKGVEKVLKRARKKRRK